MPMQQQNASLAARLGGRLAAANAAVKDKPPDIAPARLPAGIRNGIAKLSSAYTKVQENDKGMVPKGEVFFRASAIALTPEYHNGQKVAGAVTQVLIPLCDVPARGTPGAIDYKEAVAFDAPDGPYNKWRSILMVLTGCPPCPETRESDPTGTKTEAYWFAAMHSLTREGAKPVYISFSTRGWKSKKKPTETDQEYKNREEMVFEEWHGLAAPPTAPDPGAGMRQLPPPPPPGAPPVPPNGATSRQATLAQTMLPQSAPNGAPPASPTAPAEEVAGLVALAMDDPEGVTEEGADAGRRLEKLAWANGWTEEQTGNAADWAALGEMALAAPDADGFPSNGAPTTAITVGSRWYYAPRGKNGERLKNNKGEDLPPFEVEVTSVNDAEQTCTLKTKEGRDVLYFRSKTPVAVKFDWLEMVPY